ncbi:hypothetical protein A3749_07775 [Oleiphilus sp. HI0078]|uniref:ankyrin repeat domain-containing protein n=1 Tax=Oleiphilus sp. HI0132 TaxID=1822270 RepID=UPI0007C32525|nr:ankyrin repeat domain-containing protein [Oleiphilus sp. HI0132]KZY97339.1 hypothetical protein A3743_20795 [Oleiphilus sp. HI0072]KZZ11875.1 hypothetical protein A3749_07775 [Oleiphilus sp. HI0078]KZZ75445.1 hypothetical protein A3766_16670 [Oleiphilus sp. HI0132]
MLRQIPIFLIMLVCIFHSQSVLAEDFPKKQPAYDQLISAVDYTLLQTALSGKIPVDSTDVIGSTALIYAATLGDLDKVKKLINLGANINHRKHNGSTALIAAAQAGESEVVELLMNKGADPNLKAILSNVKQKDGRTISYEIDSVFQATRFNYIETLEMLLSKGANPNPNIRYTPLSTAYSQRHDQAFDLLLEYGADPNTTLPVLGGGDRVSLIELAVSEKAELYVNKLKNAGAYLDDKAQSGYKSAPMSSQSQLDATMLNLFAKKGDYDGAKQLLKKNPNIRLMPHYAVEMRVSSAVLITNLAYENANYDFVELMLLNGADANAIWSESAYNNSRDYSPMIANIHGLKFDGVKGNREKRHKIMMLLLEYGAEVFDPQLIHEAYKRDIEFAKILIEYGADPNPVMDTGITVLETFENELKEVNNLMKGVSGSE